MRCCTYMPNIVTAPKIAQDCHYPLLAGPQCLRLSSVCHSAACWPVLSYLCGSHDSELCLGQVHLECLLPYSGQGFPVHLQTLGLEQQRVCEQSQTLKPEDLSQRPQWVCQSCTKLGQAGLISQRLSMLIHKMGTISYQLLPPIVIA